MQTIVSFGYIKEILSTINQTGLMIDADIPFSGKNLKAGYLMTKPKVVLTRDDKKDIMCKEKLDELAQKKLLVLELCEVQSWVCFWCGEKMSKDPASPIYRTLEHVIPKGTRGQDVEKRCNYKVACRKCNELRATWNVAAFQAKIKVLAEEVAFSHEMFRRAEDVFGAKCFLCRLKFHWGMMRQLLTRKPATT